MSGRLQRVAELGVSERSTDLSSSFQVKGCAVLSLSRLQAFGTLI